MRAQTGIVSTGSGSVGARTSTKVRRKKDISLGFSGGVQRETYRRKPHRSRLKWRPGRQRRGLRRQ